MFWFNFRFLRWHRFILQDNATKHCNNIHSHIKGSQNQIQMDQNHNFCQPPRHYSDYSDPVTYSQSILWDIVKSRCIALTFVPCGRAVNVKTPSTKSVCGDLAISIPNYCNSRGWQGFFVRAGGQSYAPSQRHLRVYRCTRGYIEINCFLCIRFHLQRYP